MISHLRRTRHEIFEVVREPIKPAPTGQPDRGSRFIPGIGCERRFIDLRKERDALARIAVLQSIYGFSQRIGTLDPDNTGVGWRLTLIVCARPREQGAAPRQAQHKEMWSSQDSSPAMPAIGAPRAGAEIAPTVTAAAPRRRRERR